MNIGPDQIKARGLRITDELAGQGDLAVGKPMEITLNRSLADEPQVQEMVVIHRIFRREFRLLTGLVRRVPDGHTERAAAIAKHIEFVVMGLHNHHSTEDEYLWPMLRERAQPHAELIQRMEDQHAAVGEHIERATKLLAGWRQGPSTATSTDLADTLARLDAALVKHLDDEESELLPLVSQHITAAEWAAFGQRSFDKFPRSALPVMLGQVLEDATPDEQHMFLDDLPAPVRLGWRLTGRRGYTRYVARVRGKEFGRWTTVLLRRANRLGNGLYRRGIGRSAKAGLPVLLLTVPGRKTGTPHTVAVAYFEHDGGYLVAASAGGTKPEPQWFRNIRAATRVNVQVGDEHRDMAARVADRAERDRLWRDVVLARAPFFAEYEQKAGRVISIVLLTAEDAGTSNADMLR